MTVDELEVLIAKAEATLGYTVSIGKYHKGSWWMCGESSELDSVTLPEIIAKLHEWTTPPKPETLTITVPFSWVEARAGGPSMQLGDIDKVSEACREAVKPWAQS